ncbi:MAG: bleomycin resistance protein [Verrucomicrobiales bacterium]|nr:bleomycin resistance protein [Verrucomicrobiales bacterium]
MFNKLNYFSVVLIVCFFSSPCVADNHKGGDFMGPTIDLGCVVSDINGSVKFYTEAIGFKVVGGFKVPSDFAENAGLTASKELDIKVLSLGGAEGEGVTKLKLMEVKGSGGKADQSYIDSTLGFSYITIFVKDTDKALARLKKAGVKPIAKGPVTLPNNLDPSLSLTIVRDPDGNFVELVGPKPKK